MSPPPSVTGAAITLAIRDAGGCLRRAAAALGVHPTTLRDRLRVRPSLWPAGVPRGRRGGSRPAVPDEDVTDALWTARGDVRAAAIALGMLAGEARARLRQRPGVMPAELR